MAAKIRLIAYAMLVFLASYVSSKGKVPQWIKRPKPEYKVKVGRQLRIKCVFTGLDDPLINRTMVAWKKVGEDRWINQDTPRHPRYPRYKTRQKSLKITNAQPEDSGRFMCVALNEYGKQNATTTVIVEGRPTVSSRKPQQPGRSFPSTPRPKLWKGRPGQPPQFVDRPSEHRTEIKQVRGKSVKLKCRASGKPNPKITWHRNDRKLGRSQQQHLTRKGWTLAFDNLLMTDAGKYTCRVKNRFGTISRIFYVRVAPKDVPKQRPYKGLHILKNVTATEGDNATFVCKVIGAEPLVHVSWLKLNWNFAALNSKNISSGEYQVITDTNHTRRQKLVADKPVALPGTRKFSFTNRLVLLHVEDEDEGRYTCTVAFKNKAGFKSVHAFLTVKPKPEAVVVKSRKRYTKIEGEIPLAAFIGVPLAVAAVLIVSIVWCFIQTRKIKRKSPSEATVQTSETKLALELRGMSHERSNDYTLPPDEQLQSRIGNGHVIPHSHFDENKCENHAIIQCNGYDSPKRDSQSSCHFTQRHSNNQQPVKNMSRKKASCEESEVSELPSEGAITNCASVEIHTNNTGSGDSSLSNSETRQSMI